MEVWGGGLLQQGLARPLCYAILLLFDFNLAVLLLVLKKLHLPVQELPPQAAVGPLQAALPQVGGGGAPVGGLLLGHPAVVDERGVLAAGLAVFQLVVIRAALFPRVRGLPLFGLVVLVPLRFSRRGGLRVPMVLRRPAVAEEDGGIPRAWGGVARNALLYRIP